MSVEAEPSPELSALVILKKPTTPIFVLMKSGFQMNMTTLLLSLLMPIWIAV